jgi:hypothetical protein
VIRQGADGKIAKVVRYVEDVGASRALHFVDVDVLVVGNRDENMRNVQPTDLPNRPPEIILEKMLEELAAKQNIEATGGDGKGRGGAANAPRPDESESGPAPVQAHDSVMVGQGIGDDSVPAAEVQNALGSLGKEGPENLDLLPESGSEGQVLPVGGDLVE